MTHAVVAPSGVALTVPAARFCVKGRGAAAALEAAGVPLPPRPNSWRRDAAGTWCLRLGSGEFLLANDDDSGPIHALGQQLGAAGGPCHVLPRADRCAHLTGPQATEHLLRVCDIDDRLFLRQPDALALVMLADVSVTLHAVADGYRIWCDPTFASHLVEAFAAIDARSTSTRPVP
jgi:hypothetical protein